ncbi:hypothetical protein AB7M39_004949 [Bradyrhizobium diazoefficiens]
MRNGQPDGMRQLGRQPVVPERTGKANDSVGNGPCGFRKIMSDIFSDSIRILVEPSSKSNEFTCVCQSLQVNKGDTRGFEVAGAGNASSPNEIEGALAIRQHMTLGHFVIFCRHVSRFVDIEQHLKISS